MVHSKRYHFSEPTVVPSISASDNIDKATEHLGERVCSGSKASLLDANTLNGGPMVDNGKTCPGSNVAKNAGCNSTE